MRTPRRLAAVALVLCALALLRANDCQAVCNLACSPSNASAAFRQIQLLTPTSGAGYVLNAGHAGWPLSLDNAALVRAIGGGDSVLIASSRLHGVSINLDGSVTYALPPNTRANRIAAIVTANNGTDPFDYNFPLLFVSATFSDGRHWGVSTFDGDEIWTTKDLAFGHDVRN